MRLWIDDLKVLHALCPDVVQDRPRQAVGSVEICHWAPNAEFGQTADIVVEGFGCGLPEPYVEAMARSAPPPLWITLEYLSAEPWVAEHHALPSPHPRLPIRRYFFFPGFGAGTGGVLKEPDLDARRVAFQQDAGMQARFWRDLGFAPPTGSAIVASLFSYANPAAAGILDAWAGGDRPVVVAVAPGPVRPAVAAFFGAMDPGEGMPLTRGNLETRFLPFLAQHRYDELLWACGWNFVRGEDSFVRAQWAGRPLVWHVYPQEERAHRVKLNAFLELYCAGLEPAPAAALRALWHGWNEPDRANSRQIRAAWDAFKPHHERLCRHAEDWVGRLTALGDLADNLAQFCEER